MGTIVNVIAVLIAIASVLAALGHAGYLAMLGNAAKKRAGGSPIAQYVSSRWPLAAATSGVSLLAWLITSVDSVPIDVIAALLAVGSGAVATKALQSTQQRYRNGG